MKVGELRGQETMQVVSGRTGRYRVYFEAPPRAQLEEELGRFIDWFNASLSDPGVDPLLRAAICHFWFITLHPFDDGNGRLTRALTDLALAQGESQSIRLYAMSVVILEQRKGYYEVLEQCQQGELDITAWLTWFLHILIEAFDNALKNIELSLVKAHYWQRFSALELTKEQRKVINMLLDNSIKDGLSAGKYQKITKVSKATATRHLSDLLLKGCVVKSKLRGRSTHYLLPSFAKGSSL